VSHTERLVPLGAAVLVTGAGLAAREFTTGTFAKVAGVALYATLVYCLVLVVAPRTRPLTTAAVTLAISWAVEFFQLTPWPAELSARSWLARMVLGSSFAATDLLWYAVGAALGLGAHLLLRRNPTT
jgi:hypothetical protein